VRLELSEHFGYKTNTIEIEVNDDTIKC
jgi:hypothetical protein